METIFMSTENSKKHEPHKFVLKFSKRLDLRSSNKHVASQFTCGKIEENSIRTITLK